MQVYDQSCMPNFDDRLLGGDESSLMMWGDVVIGYSGTALCEHQIWVKISCNEVLKLIKIRLKFYNPYIELVAFGWVGGDVSCEGIK